MSKLAVRTRLALSGLSLCLLIAGCGSGGSRGVRTEVVAFSPEELALRQEAQDARYRLRVGDVLSVRFKYLTELDQHRILVLPDGRISMAGLESQKAAGLTIDELDATITAHFARDYRNPELSITVDELGPRSVYVLGEVRSPGLYTLPHGGEGALQAVALAGGFGPGAARSETVVMRVTDEGFLYRRIDLGKPEKSGLPHLAALDLQPYDVVYVPRSPIGDLHAFNQTFLSSMLNVGSLFWDVYGVLNLDKIDRLTR